MAHKGCDGSDCIFCNSKCPECGAEEIQVTYSPVFSYRNDTENRISIAQTEFSIELECLECDAEYSVGHDDYYGEPIAKFRRALNNALEIAHYKFFELNDNGKIKVRRMNTGPAETTEKK